MFIYKLYSDPKCLLKVPSEQDVNSIASNKFGCLLFSLKNSDNVFFNVVVSTVYLPQPQDFISPYLRL